MGLKRLSSRGLIPVWLIVLAIGITLVVVQVRGEFEVQPLPEPKVTPSTHENLPNGPKVHDTVTDLKDGASTTR